MIKMILDSVRKSESSAFYILILREEIGQRYLPVWIGPCEADAILAKLTKRAAKETPTFEYFTALLAYGDLKVEYVQVLALMDNVFHAEVVTARQKFLLTETLRFDCRPSDAVTLALYLGVPIYASSAVMDAHSQMPQPAKPAAPLAVDSYADFWDNFISTE